MADTQVEKRDNDILIISFLLGTVAVATYLAAVDEMTQTRVHIALYLFAAGILGSGVSTFIRSNLKGRSLTRACQDAAWSIVCFCFFSGGFLPFLTGVMIPNRAVRIVEDIELGNDDHCCSLCHEDVKAFSEILRLSKCERIRSRFSQVKKIVL